ncbi:hypothetical protein BN59_01696 [Legionella massiliensis]|uniref:Uncharacterized protein n=1 Tax=Legionella massiliensis TaxID=1034943 RepID=A0A078L090_9GAMM|nr:hypothetical protein BN59_01696 [Legionella massiliensis]CEE13151.1 hypothetical protein BN1094_01696 [Legionella massiliensis]
MTGVLFGMAYSKEIRHVERGERSPECGMVQIPELSHYVRDDGGGMTGVLFGIAYSKEIRHVERGERSPECGIVQIPEISHYVRHDGGAG